MADLPSKTETLADLLREARRDWITDMEWVGDQYGGVMQQRGEAIRAFGARIDAALAAHETKSPPNTIDFADACDEVSEPTRVDWISVKDRQPDHSEPVVYARPHPRNIGRWSVGIAYWTRSQRWNPEQESTEAPDGFTHWKPLGRRPGLKSNCNAAPSAAGGVRAEGSEPAAVGAGSMSIAKGDPLT